jgi:hypothetical protein
MRSGNPTIPQSAPPLETKEKPKLKVNTGESSEEGDGDIPDDFSPLDLKSKTKMLHNVPKTTGSNLKIIKKMGTVKKP